MDAGTDGTTDSTEDGKWLTYSELAGIRRIDRHSAVKLVMRHRWRRQKDNRGVLRILVPLEWALSKDAGTDRGADSDAVGSDEAMDAGTDKGTDISRAITTLEAAVTSITLRAENAEKRADRAEIRAESAESRANQAERDLAAERNRAEQLGLAQDRLESELEAARISQAEAEADAAELRQAEAARAGQGRWQRLRAAWRGD